MTNKPLKEAVETKMKGMVNKTYMYGGHVTTINGYKVTNDNVYISTTKKLLVFSHEEFMRAKGDFLETEINEGRNNTQMMTRKEQRLFGEKLDESDIIATLTDSIKKIEQGPEYIKQALAINSTVKTIMDIAKTKIAWAKSRERV